MKIDFKHLSRFLTNKPDIQDLSNKLFQLGHEHEIDNNIFNMEFTPNRGDCLSLVGLARDLNVFYETDIALPIYEDHIPSLNLNFLNQANDHCPHISFLNIEINGKISEYKDYLENYFKDLNINKNNFFTDISNYVAYEMGQPTHCYDFLSIGNDITLKENANNLKFITLLGNSIDLKGADLVFSSEDEIINLSGIIGGANTSCSKKTKSALVECAYFRPQSIIGKAVKYNLHSDASHKFERGTDPECHEKVLRRFIQIVSEHAEIKKLEIFVDNKNTYKKTELKFDLIKVNTILGTNVTKEYYAESLMKLGFVIDKSITVPSFRSDIIHQNDLAEELARVIGYDNIPISSINLKEPSNQLDHSNEDLLKGFLTKKGFTEVINSPFCSVNNPDSIKVDNPLDSNREFLRTNLIDSLIENLIYNENRQKDSIKLFEISDIYTSSTKNYYKKIAIIISGRRGQNYLDFSQKLDNKYLSKIFKEINFDIDKYIMSIDRIKLKTKIKTPIFAIELKLNDLSGSFDSFDPVERSISNFIKYEPISEFPSSYRDFSFSVKNSTKTSSLISKLESYEAKNLKDSFLFDLYENKKTGETKVGFRFIFQSHIKTLTDSEINIISKNIILLASSVDSVTLPKN